MNRRNFLSSAFFALPLIAVFSKYAWAQAKPNPDAPAVKESDPMAKGMNYCENADKGKAKVCPVRKEKERKDQYCEGCQFFTAAGKKGKDDVGNCQLLSNNLVKAKGWCNTWAKRAT